MNDGQRARRQAEERARLAMMHPRERRAQALRRLVKGGVALSVFVLALGFVYVDFGTKAVHAIVPTQPSRAAAKADPVQPGPKASPPPPSGTTADLVVLVSFDGLRPDAITPGMRALHKLYLQGASPQLARTIDKSATLPSHASMVSGVNPDEHGLDFNAYRPDRGVISRPTVFSVAHAAGLPTSMFVGKNKLKHLLARPTDAEFKMGGMLCEKLLKFALPHLREAKKGLVFLHFADVDSAGHRVGWMTDEYMEAAYTADRCLDTVMDTLVEAGRLDRTLLIVTSDHGGHNRGHGTRLDVDQRIPWFAWGAGVKRGRIARSVHTTDTAATVMAALGLALPAGTHGQPVTEAFSRPLGPAGMPMVGAPVGTP
ncbi:MAG: alkaline phosphatase [Myxococcales bacterium]